MLTDLRRGGPTHGNVSLLTIFKVWFFRATILWGYKEVEVRVALSLLPVVV